MHKDPAPKEINLDLNQDLSQKFNRKTLGRISMQTNRNSDEESLYRKHNPHDITEEPEVILESGPS